MNLKPLWIALVFLILLRLSTMGIAPLFDPTEGRYALIARNMVDSGDWVTPRLEANEPFWGKPPLHFWMTAASLKAFGNTAFAARLPSFISALLLIALTGYLARRLYGATVALWSMLILTSSALFFISAAYVITDVTLALAVSITMAAFLLMDRSASPRESLFWKYAFFAGIGLGMLAKGPVAVALCVIAMGAWLFITRDYAKLRRLPWISGSLLAFAITAPWYIWAEHRTPGFLVYFIVHEHIQRFTMKNYGDLYSSGHIYPYGTIWGFIAAGLLPWTLLFPHALVRFVKTKSWRRLREQSEITFLICWALASVVFFSIARNVVVTYVLPGFPAFAVLGGLLIGNRIAAGAPQWHTQARTQSSFRRQDMSMTVFSIAVSALSIFGIFALFFDIPYAPYKLAIALLLAILTIAVALILERSRKRYIQLICLSLCVPCVAAYGSTFLAEAIAGESTSRDLMASIRANPVLSHRNIRFYDEVPYSARFYGGSRVADDVNGKKFTAAPNDAIVIEEKDIAKLNPETLATLTRAATFGKRAILIAK